MWCGASTTHTQRKPSTVHLAPRQATELGNVSAPTSHPAVQARPNVLAVSRSIGLSGPPPSVGRQAEISSSLTELRPEIVDFYHSHTDDVVQSGQDRGV